MNDTNFEAHLVPALTDPSSQFHPVLRKALLEYFNLTPDEYLVLRRCELGFCSSQDMKTTGLRLAMGFLIERRGSSTDAIKVSTTIAGSAILEAATVVMCDVLRKIADNAITLPTKTRIVLDVVHRCNVFYYRCRGLLFVP